MKRNIRAPAGLSAEARRWWRQLVEEYEIEDSGGRLILLTMFEAFDRMRAAQKIISEEGETVKDRFEQLKAHPMVAVERDSRAAFYAGLRALNLDLEPLKAIGRPGGS
jgi:P27 family predicted phage terminase small subunit